MRGGERGKRRRLETEGRRAVHSRRDMRRGRGDGSDGRNKEGGRVSLWRLEVKEGCIEMRETRERRS